MRLPRTGRTLHCGAAILLAAGALAVLFLAAGARPATAAEDAKQFYLLGIQSSKAGFVPPPGRYGAVAKYFYSGDASAAAAIGVALNRLGNVSLQADVDADAQAFYALPSASWVTPHKILNGNLGFGLLLPVGWTDISVDVNALAALTLPSGRAFQAGAQFEINDEKFAFGDPAVSAFIGWHKGNWHWNVAGLLNVPIGSYDEDDIANIGFNRWAFDATAGLTWLDPKRGLEASVAAGFTFNGENPDTDYRTGTEFHVEFALMQSFSQAFAIGLTGYHYEQVTGDSGRGARLGDFKGRVTALGPNVTYNFLLGRTPVAASLRWYHEFNVKNRLEGDAVFATAAIPLGGVQPTGRAP